MKTNLEFEEKLLKGKVTEHIFERMFHHAGYTVIRNGYEFTHPQIAQHHDLLKERGITQMLSHTPDFILISNDNSEVYTVEVKYRSNIHTQEVKETAEKILSHWDPSFLFLATREGFFYDSCHGIINANGAISPLDEKFIPKEVQEKYLTLLKEFIK